MVKLQDSGRFFALMLWILACTACLSAQTAATFAPDQMESVLYGVAYYPEYMPYDRLDKDVEMMQKAGITVVRVGESTWSSWEPRDGDSFEWVKPEQGKPQGRA